MSASILFQLICAWGIIICVTAKSSSPSIKYKQSDIDKCEKYDAVGAMGDFHKPAIINHNATEMTQNNGTFNFEFYVQGTKKANVYLSPEPAGSVETRKGYGILIDETSDINMIVIQKYQPYKQAIDIEFEQRSQLGHDIKDIFKVIVTFQRRYNESEVCVHVEHHSGCTIDRDPVRTLTYATFFRDEAARENNFYYNCRPPTTREYFMEKVLPFALLFALIFILLILYAWRRFKRSRIRKAEIVDRGSNLLNRS